MAAILEREETNLRPSELRAALQRSRTIDAGLEQEREKRKREIQLLVLGPSCSGKSTFIKQLKILYGGGYTEEERREFRTVVYSFIRQSLSELLSHMESLGVEYSNAKSNELTSRVHTYQENEDNGNIDMEERNVYGELWEDKAIKEYLTQNHDEHNVPQTITHFLESLDRISDPSYIPSLEDILHVRLETQGIQESLFTLSNVIYRVIDVAGQQSQRKKWIHVFDGVTAVVFFASLSSLWGQNKPENTQKNGLLDALGLFEEVTHSQFLQESEFILFLNKHDLFLEHLKSNTITCCFPEYKDANSPERVLDFIKEKFLKAAPSARTIYVHVTCATHTDIMRTLLVDVFDIIIDINIKKVVPF